MFALPMLDKAEQTSVWWGAYRICHRISHRTLICCAHCTSIPTVTAAAVSILARLLELRPYAYHTCGATNFESIQGLRALVSARDLLTGTPHIDLLRMRRPASALRSSVSIRPFGYVASSGAACAVRNSFSIFE